MQLSAQAALCLCDSLHLYDSNALCTLIMYCVVDLCHAAGQHTLLLDLVFVFEIPGSVHRRIENREISNQLAARGHFLSSPALHIQDRGSRCGVPNAA